MQPQNNLATEITAIALALIFVIIGTALLVLHYITFAEAIGVWGLAAGLFVSNLAFKAPSPSQQNQLNAQNVNLQQLVQYALSVLQPQASVAPPQGQQTAQPNTGVASGQVAHVLATPPEVTLTPTLPNSSEVEVYRLAGTTPPTQFKSFTIPEVSAPYPVVGQGIPLGQ